MWANLRPAMPSRYFGLFSDFFPSARETSQLPSTPDQAKCAGRACRLEIKILPDPAACRSTVSYADKTGSPASNCIYSAPHLTPSQKHRCDRSLHFLPHAAKFPACSAQALADLPLRKRIADMCRSLSTPAEDEADRRPCGINPSGRPQQYLGAASHAVLLYTTRWRQTKDRPNGPT